MNTPRRPALVLAGLALGTLLALLIAPQTRWLVGAQFAASGLTFQSPQAHERRAEEAKQRAVAAAPYDFILQLAAMPRGEREQRVAYLRTLVPRFGSQPALYAALLRYEMGDADNGTGVYLRREEDWQINSQTLPADYQRKPPPNPTLLAAFDADAAAGEHLDPDNAYFPFMRAIGLFAAHKDALGLAAVRRAGAKTVWREYLSDEIKGRLRLAEAASGPLPAINRFGVVAGELLPQYAGLRGAARVAIVLAAEGERTGQTEQGLAIRRAVLHSGGLMRAQSTVLIGSLVGMAVAATATGRPGGADTPGASSASSKVTGDERTRQRLQGFAAYAQRIGHPDVAQEAFAENEVGRKVRTILTKAQDRSILDISRIARLAAWWAGDLLTLVNAFWFLVLGGAAAGLARLPSIQQRQPMSRKSLVVTGLMGGVTLSLLVLLVGTVAGNQDGYAGMFQQVQSLEPSDGTEVPTPSLGGNLIAAALGLSLPLLMQIGLTIAALVRRVPLSVALVEGFRKASVPAACVLILLYGGLVLGTLRQERQMNEGLNQMVQHEGRYLASLVGQTWPG